MVRVTIDTNCVYELESPNCSLALRGLVDLWKAGRIMLQIPEISASERQLGGGHLDDYGTFETRVAEVGLKDATFLSPTAYIGMAYIGHAVIGGDESEKQEEAIHQILFPNVPFDADD